VLLLAKKDCQAIVAHCLDGLPLEACGLLAGKRLSAGALAGKAHGQGAEVEWLVAPAEADEITVVSEVFPARNAAGSSRLYTVEPIDLLRADRTAADAGLSLVGVWHSHTHTPPYPSPTDIAQAPDPDWHYVLVSLSAPEPAVRSYRIVGEAVTEETVALVPERWEVA
jgi:[CysO sulfur-carrier protein]-S-L-cysteine hydrolase